MAMDAMTTRAWLATRTGDSLRPSGRSSRPRGPLAAYEQLGERAQQQHQKFKHHSQQLINSIKTLQQFALSNLFCDRRGNLCHQILLGSLQQSQQYCFG
jgi:hypothetical protein